MADIIVGYIINLLCAGIILSVIFYWASKQKAEYNSFFDFVCSISFAFVVCLLGFSTYDFVVKILERI